MTRALLLGATGMLAAAARHAAMRADECVLVSRGADAFSFGSTALDEKLTRLPLSYEDEPALLDQLAGHAPFDLALTWIRPRAELLRAALDALRSDAFAQQSDITYAQVILGFVRENGASRWLNHEEISAAAIAQMEMPLPRRIAGTLEPWDERPR